MTGYARYTTKLSLPTAMFLLILVGFLGVFYRTYERGLIGKQTLKHSLIFFEISLLIASVLSYGKMSYAYFLAYNAGIGLFLWFQRKSFTNEALDKLGAVGMTFFLGAKTPMLLLNYNFDEAFGLRIIGCLLEFVLGFILALAVTKYIENPLMQWARKNRF